MNEMILAPRSAEFNEDLVKGVLTPLKGLARPFAQPLAQGATAARQGFQNVKGKAYEAGTKAVQTGMGLGAGAINIPLRGAEAAIRGGNRAFGSGEHYKGGQYIPGMGNPIANLGYGMMTGGVQGGLMGAAKRGQQQRYGIDEAETEQMAQKVRGSELPQNVAGAFSGVRGGNTQQQSQISQRQPQPNATEQNQQPQVQINTNQQSFTPNRNLRNQRYKQEMKRANTRGGIGTGLLSNIATLGMSGLARGAYNLAQRQAGRQNMAAIEQGAPLSTLKSEMETIGLREMIRNRQTTEAIRDAYR
jgi:hypothetical protein